MSKIKERKDFILSISFKISELDTRIDRCKLHRAETIVFVTISAVLCGCRTWNDIEDFGWSKLDFFSRCLGGIDSIPSHDTISRFFKALDPDRLEERYRAWVRYIINRRRPDNKPPTCDDERDVVAVDGKTICGASETAEEKELRGKHVRIKGNEHSHLHVVSAYSTEHGLSLGQVKVDGKSNEIPAVRELLGLIDIKGCIITADAMNCQRKTIEAIVNAGARFMLTVKANQDVLLLSMWDVFRAAKGKPGCLDEYETRERGHGRDETRRCRSYSNVEDMTEDIRRKWPWVRTCGEIRTTRREPDGKETTETRWFVSNLDNSARTHMRVVRKHWQVENNLHWQLDVNFMEDAGRKKNNEALNFSTICKIALAALKNSKDKRPINRKMKVAGWNEEYLMELLKDL